MKPQSLNAVGWVVLVCGMLSAIPSACVLVDDSPDADAQVAMLPVIRLPFEGLNQTRVAKSAFDVPLRWERMKEEWGDPVYVVMARRYAQGSQILPFDKLGLHVIVTSRGRSLSLERPTYMPYGYSVDDGQIGVIFKPQAGDPVLIEVSVAEEVQLPAGELVVVGFSNSFTKDRAVGDILDQDFRRWSKRLLPGGIALIAIGAFIAFVTRTRGL